MQLFPYFLLRLAGLPFSVLEKYSAFSESSEAQYKQLQKDIQLPVFQAGLPFSSLDFVENLHHFLEKSPEQFRKKEFQKARTALKYLTRTAAKCSPFADFTSLSLLHLDAERQILSKDKCLINFELLNYFHAQCIENEQLKSNLLIFKNSTLHAVDGNWKWILNIENQEHWQSVEDNELLQAILKILDTTPQLRYADFLKKIAQNFGKSKKIKAFVEQLFQIGFLEFKLPFLKSEQGFEAFQKYFDENNFPSHVLDNLIKNKISNNWNINELKQISHELDCKIESLFFKDVVSQNENLHQAIRDWQPQMNALAVLYKMCAESLIPFHYSKLKDQVFSFLDQQQIQAIPLIELYELFFHSDHETTQSKEEKIIFNRNVLENWLSQNIDFQEDTINISNTTLTNLHHFSKQITDVQLSTFATQFNLILQPIGNDQAFCSGASMGYGKQFLRFLHLFDNEQLSSDFEIKNNHETLYLELNDTSLKNVNFHQAIAPYELNLPNSWNKQDSTLSLLDIDVKKDKNQDYILVEKSSGKKILPLDLGLEHPNRRAASYQLLTIFAEALPSLSLLSNPINQLFVKKHENANYFPRIIIDNQLVIQRKHWFFPIEELPKITPKESIENYALRMQNWASSENLPRFVFISIPFEINLESDENEMLSPDDYKPQFIDFQNIILLNLFGKIINRVPQIIKIEEMLPTPDELWEIEGEKRVFELLIQI